MATGKKSGLLILFGILAVIVIYFIITFNGLVKKDEKVNLQWNEVQNAYQRRLDLVPNLVNVVKGVSEYEQTVLREVTEARAKAARATSASISSSNYKQQSAAQDELAGATNRLLITVERYPELKGTRAYKDLQVQLEGTERRIKVTRKDFNTAVAEYNSSVKSFPTNMVAGMLGFPPKDGFASDAGADKAVEIKF